MKLLDKCSSRRHVLKAFSLGAVASLARGAWAEELVRTAAMTEGPFYPDKMPLDTDNDLLLINDSITPAVGQITHLAGRILSQAGEPLRNAFVEIWQADNHGAYLHSGTANADVRDGNFQGYGRFLTDAEGRYYFRTIKPTAYPGRCPHIHFGISRGGQRIFTTQMFVAGDPDNERDGLYQGVQDPAARRSITIDFRPVENSPIGELAANFDIVLGRTPADPPDGAVHGLGKPDGARGSGGGPSRGARRPPPRDRQ